MKKKTFLTPCSKFIDVLFYKHTITLMTLFMNRLFFFTEGSSFSLTIDRSNHKNLRVLLLVMLPFPVL